MNAPEAPHRSRPTRPRSRLPNLRRAMFVLPNLFTLSSIFCGFYAIVLCAGESAPGQLYRAALAVFFGAFFDGADGRVARLTRTQSEFGVQLDSLADTVTFGVAPAVIAYKWGLVGLGPLGVFVAFVYAACGAIRLARFNVLASRSKEGGGMRFFVGLPIPLAAGVVVSLVMFHQRSMADHGAVMAVVERGSSVAALLLVLSYLMVSNVRYRTFKDFRPNRCSLSVAVALLVLLVVIAAQARPTFAILVFFGLYVVMGLLEEIIAFVRPSRRSERGSRS